MATAPSTEAPPAAISARGVGAADVGDQRDDPVEPLAVERGRNDLVDHDVDAPDAGIGTADEDAVQDQRGGADVHGDVGDVEDREPLEVDEVDDRTLEPGVAAEQAVEQVAGGATDQASHAERGRASSRRTAATPAATR